MSLHSLGAVTASSGTPTRITSNQADPSARIATHSLLIEALPTNTGKVWIGLSTMDKASSTKPGILAVLAIPTANVIPGFSATISYAPGGFNAADYYIDPDVNGDGVVISYIRG